MSLESNPKKYPFHKRKKMQRHLYVDINACHRSLPACSEASIKYRNYQYVNHQNIEYGQYKQYAEGRSTSHLKVSTVDQPQIPIILVLTIVEVWRHGTYVFLYFKPKKKSKTSFSIMKFLLCGLPFSYPFSV